MIVSVFYYKGLFENVTMQRTQMVVHPGKSEVMKIGTQRCLKNPNDLNIFVHDHRLKEVTSYKYLGVYVDSITWLGKSIFHICKTERIQKSVEQTEFLVFSLEAFY